MKLAADMLIECLTCGHLTNEFALMAMEVGKRVINSDSRVRTHNREDAFSRFCENLVKKWKNIKPEGNIKAYISAMAYTSLQDEKRKFKSDMEKKTNLFSRNCINASNKNQAKKEIEEKLIKRLDIKSGHDMNKEERIVIRREFIRLYKLGISKYKIAKHMGFPESTMMRWEIQYKELGKAFIFKDNRRKGKKKRIKGK